MRITMTEKIDSTFIQIIHPVCCGLDVHKDKISACLLTVGKNGEEVHELREFGTFTEELYDMEKWLVDNKCPVVAMESTGVYWRPIHNVIENSMQVLLVNARHIKNVPGRKTDLSDSKWLAGLLRHGLLKGSFIPPDHIREIRELARLIKVYTESAADYKRRIHKLFITSNIKIDSVVSDLFGKTGRNLMDLLCKKSDITIEDIEANAKGSLKSKAKELHASIQGFFKEHHRFQLIGMLKTILTFEDQIAQLNKRVTHLTQEHEDLLNRLDAIPGIDKKSAQAIIGEVGITLEEFACVAAFASWAGLCPGNNESAGKRKSGRSPVRNHPLKTLLVQIAWAAIKTKGSYYKAKYYKLKAKRGAKKAIVAIAHRIGKAIYNIIKNGDTYRDLGEDFLTGSEKQRAIYNLKKKADLLGFDVVPCPA